MKWKTYRLFGQKQASDRITHVSRHVCTGNQPSLSSHGFEVPPDELLWTRPGSDDPQLVLQQLMRVEQRVLIFVSRPLSPSHCLLWQLPAWTWCYCPQQLHVQWRIPLPLFWFWPRCRPRTWTGVLEELVKILFKFLLSVANRRSSCLL